MRVSTCVVAFFSLIIISTTNAQDLMFRDSAVQAGLQGLANKLEFGVAWGDFDNDGDDDLFVATANNNQLFQNNGDGTFTDIAEAAGVQDDEMAAIGGAWGDFDNDGDLDLYVCNIASVEEDHGPENRLFVNQGDGTFVDMAEEMGVTGHAEEGHHHDDDDHGHEDGDDHTPTQEDDHDHDHAEDSAGSTSAAWVDFNNDGFLDLSVAHRDHGVLLYVNHDADHFDLVTEAVGIELDHDHEGEHEGDDHGHDGDDHGHEDGDDHTPTQDDDHDHEEGDEGFAVDHVSWADYDNDGDMDLFVSVIGAPSGDEGHEHEDDHDHDHGTESLATPFQEDDDDHDHDHDEEHSETENLLFMNLGDGTFMDVTDAAGVGAPNEARTNSAVWGDYNNDGFVDLYVCNIGSYNEGTAAPHELYRNNGDGTFTNVAAEAGIVEENYLLNAAWVDINNDGWLDLSAINHPSHDDFEAGEFYEEPHPLYINNQDGTFTNINADAADAILDTGITDINHVIGLAWNDFDGDGDADAFITENHADGPFLLYENMHAATDASWIRVATMQSEGNLYAVGARVIVSNGETTQIRYVGSGDVGYGSQSSLTDTFGLGTAENAEITVVWPDGTFEAFGTLAAGEKHTLMRGTGTETSVHAWSLY